MTTVNRIGLAFLPSLIGAVFMYLYVLARVSGALVQWESLGAPPSKAVQIIGPEAQVQVLLEALCGRDDGS